LNSKEETALKILERYILYLTKKNFHVSEPIKNEYSYQVFISEDKKKISLHVFFGKKGNKIILQGNKDLKLYKEVDNLIFGEKLITNDKPDFEPSHPYIGTDESGKGDYFGPLVIAGVYLTTEAGNYLRSLGVRDSKELSDLQIQQLAADIKKVNEIVYDVVLISPEKYNELYEKMGNLNRLMGWAHARVIENLLVKCSAEEVISDKFGNEKIILDALQQRGRSIKLNQITKAEKFTAVAAASILARESVVGWFKNQSKKYKIEIPKGSSSEVETVAKHLFEKYGEDILKKLVKVHFKTSNKVFNK
jgi:ribonuclease HIII